MQAGGGEMGEDRKWDDERMDGWEKGGRGREGGREGGQVQERGGPEGWAME